jgi:hypothetical protein
MPLPQRKHAEEGEGDDEGDEKLTTEKALAIAADGLLVVAAKCINFLSIMYIYIYILSY